MAAMYKIVPQVLGNQLMFGAEENQTFETLYSKLASFANTRQSLKLAKKFPGQPQRGGGGAREHDPMDIGAMGKGKGNCYNCGSPDHFAARCPKGKGRGGAPKGAPYDKGWGEDYYSKDKGGTGKKGKGDKTALDRSEDMSLDDFLLSSGLTKPAGS